MNDDRVDAWLCLSGCNLALKNGSDVGFLTSVELSTIMEVSRMWLVLMIEEFLQVTLSALPWYEQLGEQLTVCLHHFLLGRANRCWYMSGKVNQCLLDWYIEGGFFIPFKSIHKLLETDLTFLKVCANQLSGSLVSNILCVKWKQVSTLLLVKIACENDSTFSRNTLCARSVSS